MQPRPSFDRELLIVIAVGVILILGLVWIFLTNYPSESPIPPTVEPTAIPFDFSPLETGTLPAPSATPTLKETPPTASATSPDSYPGPPAETLPSATPTPDQVEPLPAGRY